MAKGQSDDPSAGGRRSSSRNAKPYDANNSFVKKVATKVTDFIPQIKWSAWFNTSQGNEDALDVRENLGESELADDAQQPPPSKRPRIRMDVIHPPGTFSIRPRNKTALNTIDHTKEQYSVHNNMSEDFLEPVTAGPSGINHLISSIPATQTDVRTVTSHRSDLNSLTSPTNNGTTNGTDDHSESSESTSGCSSLTPQINRQEGPSNLLYSFSNRKRHIDDRLTFTNHLQSPRSLFLDSNSRDTLSSRRPSFNASVVTNALDRASPLSSPFYSGNITFGGASAAGLYKRSRNLFNNSSELQLKVPRRTNVEVKPPNVTEVDSSGMSQTAKKILEALEHFSSPISDAKRIPLRSADSASICRKRARGETTPSARVGLRHLTRELTVPTVPDILKLRRRQKLQDTTVAARKIVSARNDPPSAQEYQLGVEDSNRERYHGKIRGKSKRNLEEEETVEPVNLPNIPLPISTLPNFNFTLSPIPHAMDKANKQETFTFASPIKVTNAEKSSPSFERFTFSNPINAGDSASSIMIDSSSSSRAESETSPASPDNRALVPNFIWSGSSTAPRLKEKAKNSKDNFTPVVAHELKSGSVMDVLCPKSDKAESNFSAQSSSGSTVETVHIDKTVGMSTDSDIKSARDSEFSSSSVSDVAKSLSDWECSECLIRNSSSVQQCTACKVLRSRPKVPPPILTTDTIAKVKPVANDCFGSQFKLSTNQWECTVCYVRNKQNDIKCVACLASKPANKPATQHTTPATIQSPKSDLMEKFKPAEGSWECSGCLLRNAVNVITCPCCTTSKPTFLKASSRTTDTIAESSAQTLTPFSMGSTAAQTAESSISDTLSKFKPSKNSWECPGCFVRNNSSVSTCPCCSTAKPSAMEDANKMEQTLTANGFGDKFKRPEGAWNCNSCLLQNDAKNMKCVACEASKPGTTKSSESASSTSGSTLQFNFSASSSTGGFKFGIDKTDNQSKSDTASPLNGFKFGNMQQNSGTMLFTFGIPKEENKAGSEAPKITSGVATSSSGFTGFQFNPVKASEKSDIKSDQKIKQDASFSASKNNDSPATSEKPITSIVPCVTSTSTLFTFGAQKPGFNQPAANKETPNTSCTTTVTESSKLVVVATVADSPASISTNTMLLSSQSDTKPTSIFTFGASSSKNAVSSDTSTSATTASLPTFAQPSFAFSNSKTTAQSTTVPAFGQISTSSTTLAANVTFSGDKVAETTSILTSENKPTTSDIPTTSIFPISNPTSLFNSNKSKTISFGADGKSSGFTMSENKIPAFGNNDTDSKSAIFSTPGANLPMFNSGEKTDVFNSPGQLAATNPLPAFGAPTSATSMPFGSSSGSSIFGSNAAASAFGSVTAPIFSSTTKSNESSASQVNPTPLFTFGGNQSTQQSSGSGFNFSGDANSTSKQPFFLFGNNSNTQNNNNKFLKSRASFAYPTGGTANFAFNAPKQETPAFGQGAMAPSMFNTNPQTQATPSSSTGFNFGSTAPPAASTGGFNFGGMPSTSTPTGGFNFNPPTSTPTVAFDPNSRPSFNFTKGNAPTSFNAPTASAPRKIKKAFRRCVR